MSDYHYWVTQTGHVVEERKRTGYPGDHNAKIYAYNVPSGGFRGVLWLKKLRLATADEVADAITRAKKAGA